MLTFAKMGGTFGNAEEKKEYAGGREGVYN